MERVEKEETEDINNIERLPEGCISEILSLTSSPADVCRSSLVSTLFKSAAESDVVWEKFLPADYQEIISREFNLVSSAAALSSKKELYYRLSDEPLLIDGGTKSLQLEKSSGKNCIMVGAEELAITWGDDPRYWHWRDNYPDGSRFAKVPVLQWVCWLEIRGKMETKLLSPKTYYVAYLVLKLEDPGHPADGFDNNPISAEVKVVGYSGFSGKDRQIYLHARGEHSAPDPKLEGQTFARERGDGWMEVEMGHFYNKGGSDDDEGEEVHMSVFDFNNWRIKRGLVVQGMELRPMVQL